MEKDHIDKVGFFSILTLTLLWGLNYTAIKVSNTGLSPVFMCFLRSAIASGCGIVYCLFIRQSLFHRDIRLIHGIVVGSLFGIENGFLYLGVLYTEAARAAVLLYLSPFVVAIGAHFFLKEKLDKLRAFGLVLAFVGVYLVFTGRPSSSGRLMLVGDLLEITAAIFWGALTLYIKKYLAPKVHPINTFLYQLVFSLPILFIFAYVVEPKWIIRFNLPVMGSIIYQSVIVAFASYLVWFKLIHRYPVTRLAAFTFLTPVFGVIFGVLFLGDHATFGLIGGLVLVCVGIYCVNHK